MDNNKRLIVISAVNLYEGGTLTILKDALSYANEFLSPTYRIIALVHKKETFPAKMLGNIVFYEYPESRKSYFKRLYLEYIYFNKLSKQWKPYLWFSLHDITPNVQAKIRVVYCHNPSPFKQVTLSYLFFQPVLFFFTLFYKYLYQINIKKNRYVVVQQLWLKKRFLETFDLIEKKVLVCYPQNHDKTIGINASTNLQFSSGVIFFYPALARPFKNFEVVCRAAIQLVEHGITNFEIILTINGNENNYAKYIYKRYGHISQLRFIGSQSLEHVHGIYKVADCLLFSSNLETWGLPITEFKEYSKPIILSDLPYAHETLGEYNKAIFFNQEDYLDLTTKMISIIDGKPEFNQPANKDMSVLRGWKGLFKVILNENINHNCSV